MANKVSKVIKSAKSPVSIAGDIPEAVRDQPTTDANSWWKLLLIASAGLGFGGLLMIGTIIVANLQPPVAEVTNSATPENSSPTTFSIAGNSQPNSTTNTPSTNSSPDNLLGHYPYSEAPTAELQALGSEPKIQLRRPAAESFDAMVQAAKAQGISLIPLSGFRSLSDQQHLFFDVKAERGQVATKRAEVSAPPGYSEHHTGYAIDMGDGKVPATNLSTDFEKTDAFQWLQQNAARFSFEMSFTPNNAQGVSYEPWHWRFVGDIKSLETFYKTRQNAGGRSPNSSVNSPSTPSSTPSKASP
jgi:zinc D-Ala-D-Ala carboxypeptidase